MPVVRSTLACFCIVASFAACEGAEPRATDTLIDDFGVPVSLGDREPSRIVSLNPTTTEILFTIGAGDRVIGRSRWDLYPVEVLRIPALGDAIRPSVEVIMAARPDLVVLYASADNRPAADRLRAAGIRTIGLKIDLIEEFADATRLLGALTGERARADAVVDSVHATLEFVRDRTRGLDPPSVFWHIWDAPLITIGSGSFLHELVEIAGGSNVYGFAAEISPSVSLEDVAKRDPRFVLAGQENARNLRRNPAWQSVAAVRAGRVLVVDTTLVARPSVKLGEAAVSLARLLHPELAW